MQLCLRSLPLGLHIRILNSPCFQILLIHTKHKTIRWNFGLTRCFYSLEGELIHWVDKAKIVWLIVGQLPIKAHMLPSRSLILAEPINKTIFPSNTVATFIAFNDSVSWFLFLHKIVFIVFLLFTLSDVLKIAFSTINRMDSFIFTIEYYFTIE